MADINNNIIELMKAKLTIYKDLQKMLERIIDHKEGSAWGVEKVNKVENFVRQLKDIDMQIYSLVDFPFKIPNSELERIIEDHRNIVVSVKRLLNIFQTRIKGGQQYVSSILKNVIQGMDVKNYRNSYNMNINHNNSGIKV